jgi:hypothetical protein
MKTRALMIVFCVLVLLSILTVTAVLSGNSTKPLVASHSIIKLRLKDHTPDPAGTIDGAKNPEKIPDRIAYTILFRLIGGRDTEEEKNRMRSYIKQMLGCKSCSKEKVTEEELQAYNGRIDAIVNAAEEFYQRVGALDKQVQEINKDNWPNYSPEKKAQLTGLQRQKEAIVDEITTGLLNKLDKEGKDKLRKHINERVKHKIKILPSHQKKDKT